MSADTRGMGDWERVMGEVLAWHAHAPVDRQSIRLGERELEVLVARSPGQWARGLAGHDPDESMLFIMPSGSRHAFGMRGLDHPLAIGFFDDGGRMVDVGFMRARQGFKQPRRPYQYALEVPLSNAAGICALVNRASLAVP